VIMTEDLAGEIQRRIDDLIEDQKKNPEAFYNSVMHGILMGLQEARDVIERWGKDD